MFINYLGFYINVFVEKPRNSLLHVMNVSLIYQLVQGAKYGIKKKSPHLFIFIILI